MTLKHRLRAVAALLCLYPAQQNASAEPAPEPATPPAGENPTGLTPPRLLSPVSRAAPEGLKLKTHFAVDLELQISETGVVTRVSPLVSERQLTEDEVTATAFATEQAGRLLFEPAMEAGVPVAVIIEYRYWIDAPETPQIGPSVGLGEAETVAPKQPQISSPDSKSEVDQELHVFEAVAEVDAPAREATRRTIDRHKLSRVPGTRGDPIRAIELQPGVSRSPEGQNPILRGAASNESAAFLDGTPIPILYHFGGLTSVVQARFLKSVDLYPGNFSSRFGRATGGVIEAQLREPGTEALDGVVDLSLLDSAVMLESPLNDSLSVAVGARRSNIDFVFEQLVPEDAFNVVAAPLYWDYQGVLSQRFDENHRLRLAAFGSSDQIALLFDEPNSEDPTLRGALELALEFHQLQLSYEGRLDDIRQRASLSYGRQSFNQVFGPETRADLVVDDFAARAEWELPISKDHAVVAGFDTIYQVYRGSYRGGVASSQEGSPPLDDKNRGRVELDRVTIHRAMPALYVEGRLNPTSNWQLIPGVRFDYYGQLDALTVNPRLSQRLNLSERTTLKVGLGAYSQPPEYYEAFAPVGNPEVDPFHSIHSSLGVEQTLSDSLKIEVEGFYKWLYERVVGTAGGAPPLFENAGDGRIYGLETAIAFEPRVGTFAQLSYTLSRSERRDFGRRFRLFDQDQPHVLSLVAGHSFGSGWELGARFRYVSGNPNTPVTGAIYDARRDVYAPRFAALNSDRDAGFRQLDLRAEKQFKIGTGKLAVYLDVQNVENRENPEGFGYSYDYSEKEVASGLPFFPNLGLRGEL